MKSLLPLFIAILLVCSCTVSKRRYSSGYHIDFRSGPASVRINDRAREPELISDKLPGALHSGLAATGAEKTNDPAPGAMPQGEDTLVFVNGARLCARVTNIDDDKIVYKDCGSAGQSRTVARSLVRKIIYSNGRSENMDGRKIEKPLPGTEPQVIYYDPDILESGKRKIFLAVFLPLAAMLLFTFGILYYFMLFYAGILVMAAAFVVAAMALKAMRKYEVLRKRGVRSLITTLLIVLPIFFLVMLIYSITVLD